MTKIHALVLVMLCALTPPASACQQIRVDHPGIRESAQLVAEAVVTSSAPNPGHVPNPMDPGRVLSLRVTKVLKGKAPKVLRISTAPCYVPGYMPGRLVTVVRFPDGEHHIVERPQH